MNDFIKRVEEVLSVYAEQYTPEGSDVRAVVHQWMHAIYNNSAPFGSYKGADIKKIVSLLSISELFSSKETFKESIAGSINFPPVGKAKFKFVDIFAGIGGFRISLQDAGGACVFSSEWDKGAQNTYYSNYSEYPFGDITKFTSEAIPDKQLSSMIPDHEVLAAGFPCQPFSHAGVSARNAVGKKHGFQCNTQGTLFFDILRITSVKKPKVLFLENVRNIERHDGGRTFKIIKESIEELGYSFKHAIIDSSSLVPQRRIRCYMVCFRKDLKINFKFPEISGEPIPLKTILDKNVPDKFTISDKLWQGHINRTQRNLKRGTGFTAFTADLDKPSNTIVARYGKDGKECLVPQKGKNPRMLTPRECARLQGYPENFILPVAKTTAYKQFGNSLAIPVVRIIANKIIENL